MNEVHSQARRGRQTFWNWIYTCLAGMWLLRWIELKMDPLKELQELATAEPSLKILGFVVVALFI